MNRRPAPAVDQGETWEAAMLALVGIIFATLHRMERRAGGGVPGRLRKPSSAAGA